MKPFDHAPSEREVTANFCAKGFKGLSYKNWVPPRKASQRCASISKNISRAITSNNPQEYQTYLLIYDDIWMVQLFHCEHLPAQVKRPQRPSSNGPSPAPTPSQAPKPPGAGRG